VRRNQKPGSLRSKVGARAKAAFKAQKLKKHRKSMAIALGLGAAGILSGVFFLSLDKSKGTSTVQSTQKLNSALNASEETSGPFKLSTVWNVSGTEQVLKAWSLPEVGRLKRASSREKDPMTGELVHWEGVLLSEVVERSLSELPAERKAQIDLLVLRSQTGAIAMLPRALATKYPVLLATARDRRELATAINDNRGPVYSVMPWTTRPRILNEDLPIETYFLPKITRIELTNYRERFANLFLKRRTDPLAMRGEKLFVQNCVSCHAVGKGSLIEELAANNKAKDFFIGKHPELRGLLKLNDRDRRSLSNYLDAYRNENSLRISDSHTSGQAAPVKPSSNL